MKTSLRRAVLCLAVSALTAFLGAGLPTPALADSVAPGVDLFETAPGTFQDFSATPIPPGFFAPGSEPFQGTVILKGAPLAPGASTDTMVRRLAPANLVLPLPSSDTVPIEIIGLSLVSVSPITVTYNGGHNPEQWDVKVTLSTLPQPPGTMTITKTNPNGGTFSSILPVLPLLTFTRISDAAVRPLDLGILGAPALQFRATAVPWTQSVPPGILAAAGFCASCGPNGERVQTSELAQLAAHNIIPAITTVATLDDLKTAISGSGARAGYRIVLTSLLSNVQTYLRLNTVYGKQAACTTLNGFKLLVTFFSMVPSTGVTATMATAWKASADLIRGTIPCWP